MGQVMAKLILVVLVALLGLLTAATAGRRHHRPRLGFQVEPISQWISPDSNKTTLRCQPTASSAQVSWLLNEQPLVPERFGWRVHKHRLVVELNSSTPTAADLQFQCLIRGQNEAMVSQPAKLQVAYIDNFPHAENDETVTVLEGNVAMVPCQLPNSLPRAISEFLVNDSSLIDRSKGRFYLMPSGQLQIFRARASDSGIYQCIAHNAFLGIKRNSTKRIILKVRRASAQARRNTLLRWAQVPKTTTTPITGTNETLECVANGPTPPNVTWTRLGNAGLPKFRHVQVGGNLVIISVRPDDDGTYVCTAQTDSSMQITARTVLTVQEPPQIIKTLQDVALHDGQEFSLDCSAKGNPKPTIRWLFNGRKLDEQFREQIEVSIVGQNSEKLVVRNPRKEMHEGLYQCFAENDIGTIYQAARVLRAPPNTDTDYDYLFRGEDYGFRPSSSRHDGGRPNNKRPPKINCSKPRSEWNKRERKRCPKDYEEEPDEEEEGDEYDSPPIDSHYNVPEKPSVIRLSTDSAMVRWALPNRPGLNILFFKVQYKEQTKGATWQTVDEDIEPNARAFAMTGLKPEGKYRFRVAAVYENNDNQMSRQSEVFDFTQPPKGRKPTYGPVIAGVHPVSASALLIKWTFMEKEESNIEGYFIYFRSVSSAGGFTKDTVLQPSARQHIITHLLPDHGYEVKMQSFNEHGVSEFTQLASNKTQKSTVKTTTVAPTDEPGETRPTLNDDQTLYIILGIAIVLLMLVIIVVLCVCIARRRQKSQPPTNAVKRRQQKPKERHPKAHSVHNLSHNGFMHDYGNPYGNYQKGLNGISSGTLGLKSSFSTNGFVFKDSADDKHEINIRINPLLDEASFEGRSRTLSSSTFLGARSLSTRDIMMRRTSSISQHSLHNSSNNTTSSHHHQNVIVQNNNILNNVNHTDSLPSNNLNDPAESTTSHSHQQHQQPGPHQSNGFVLNTIERGRRGRASGHFNHDELHPHAKLRGSSSFTRLNGTLERRRKSRTDLLAAVDGTLKRECEPMIRNCNGHPTNLTTGTVIMSCESSC